MTRALSPGHKVSHAQALLLSADPAWGYSSGLDVMLSRLGFSVCVDLADVADSQSVTLTLVHCPLGQQLAAERLDDVSLPKGSLCFAAVPADGAADVDPLLPAHLHGVLPVPLVECTLIKALASRHYITLTTSECQTLKTKVEELTCGDLAVTQHFVRLLIDTNAATLSTLHDAFSTLSWDAMASAAHRMAGSARMLDCTGLIAFLVRLERAAREREQELARAIVQVVGDTVDRLEFALRELLEPATPS